MQVIEVARKKAQSHDHRPEASETAWADSGWLCERLRNTCRAKATESDRRERRWQGLGTAGPSTHALSTTPVPSSHQALLPPSVSSDIG